MERGDLMGKNGKGIRARKKILDALEIIDSPFTSKDMSILTGEETRRVAGILKDFDNVESIPDRNCNRRVIYKVI